jgi:hypothetical protein
MPQLYVLFVGMGQNFSFSTDILWLYAHSTPCLAMITQLTAIRLMFSFEVSINIVHLITDTAGRQELRSLRDCIASGPKQLKNLTLINIFFQSLTK